MNTYFISDLHLDAQHPQMIDLLVNFLQTTAANADALYILGDLFEVWIGDDDPSQYIQQLKTIFKKLTITVPVYFMHGNRDFLVGEQFAMETGIQLLKDPSVINLYGTPTLLTHGDLLCIDDHNYQLFRHKVRDEKNQKIFLRLPFIIRKMIARFLRNKSKKRAAQNDYQFIDANFAEIKKQMQQHAVKQIIYGHTHQPCIEYFNHDNEMLMRMTLSDWEGCGNVLVCGESGEKRLVYL
jgi:UDP-2,3-diacylglucosamine hydrolase